jgi:hypothetical protein
MSSALSTTLQQPSEAIASPGDTAPDPQEIVKSIQPSARDRRIDRYLYARN